MTGETADRHPGEHAQPSSPPGWYADPVRESSLRRWDGEHWTADVDPPAAVVEVQPSAKGHPLNWPALVATLMAAWYWAWFMGFRPLLPTVGELAIWVLGPPVLVLLGWLGTRRKYSTASRIGALISVLIGGLGFGFVVNWWFENRLYPPPDVLFSGPLLVVFGLLRVRRKYAWGRWVAAGLAALGVCLLPWNFLWLG